jgi:hypothetical protein
MPRPDIDALAAATLDGSQMLMVLIKPEPELVQLTGNIDGTNKEFTFPASHRPISTTSYKRITPIPDDIDVVTRKGTTDIGVTVSSIKTLEDPETGYTLNAIAELAAAPTAEGADGVYGKCSVEHDLYVQQSIKPKVDQDNSDIPRMGSRNVHTKWGGIKTSYDVEVLLSDLNMVLLGNYEESSETGVQTGFELHELMDTPLVMGGYVPIFSGPETPDPADREVLGYIMLESVTKAPSLPEGKANDSLTVTMTLNVGEKPRILLKKSA